MTVRRFAPLQTTPPSCSTSTPKPGRSEGSGSRHHERSASRGRSRRHPSRAVARASDPRYQDAWSSLPTRPPARPSDRGRPYDRRRAYGISGPLSSVRSIVAPERYDDGQSTVPSDPSGPLVGSGRSIRQTLTARPIRPRRRVVRVSRRVSTSRRRLLRSALCPSFDVHRSGLS